ncbi:polynucleotide kinase-phosphatase [Kineosporia rhizophila]|uniref:polynucleotide kinase-phosphatase n=1 Tax=Kineosporia TaxID=49184 RepID=UPI001E4EF963|nr:MULTISPECIES: polynucleotide kinase-phosphatase [Kineosporia]MCE0539613.1 polynucleotide kinase-phosphatase [Kineosporia rhizophila]GLY17960.1 polynucleotide kinase-phosphatase [Kineosporia sp. NBRC 101677]
MSEHQLTVPQTCLVVLVGVSGSGKSTFAAQKFGRYEVLSSDFCRGLVSNDENSQDATAAAFDVLHHIAGKRLEAGLLTVVDATNVQKDARASLLKLARDHDVLPVAIVLDIDKEICLERNAARTDRDFPARVIHRQADQLRRSLAGLRREGFRRVHVLDSPEKVAASRIVREPLLNDRRGLTGPFDVIGDVHGCRSELQTLLGELGYGIVLDPQGRPVDAVPPAGRTAVFVGDLVDRGPDTPGVLRLVMGMVESGHALCVSGNHEHKLVRALGGKNVKLSHGLQETMDQLAAEPEEFRAQVATFCENLIAHFVLDGGRLVVAHAGLKESYHGRASGRVRSFALYGDTSGETDEFGLPVRYPWANDYRGKAMVLYGHTPTLTPEWVNNTMCLDTGCVFGGRLTAMRYPEKEVVSVPAEKVWYEPAKPLNAPKAKKAAQRDPDVLTLGDVSGKRSIQTKHHGRITVSAEAAAGALEVMSRFALDPRWLLHLPPTMAPSPTSALPNLLEHPAEALAAYAKDGVGEVICEEKHMGSRAVILVCRDATVASVRFGFPEGRTGAIHTRTGRSFFSEADTETMLGRARAALEKAKVWEELEAGWVLLDAEIMPWSLKAGELIRQQYAAVGAAATSALPPALEALTAAADRLPELPELAGLRDHTAARLEAASAFGAAYRRYVWPTEGLEGVKIAPFQVLAAGRRTFADRDHTWHLALADRLVEADPLFVTTRRLVVDPATEEGVSSAVAWWEELTGAGGEGMVVKPLANFTRTKRGLVQPGLKVRGPEYLRIIYGPDYLLEENLNRLKSRSVGRKRSAALREYALGLEALERVTAGAPLWQVHEAVFAVLALESEPIDPRL